MTSSPPSSCVSKAVWTGFPASPAGNCPKGLRSLVDLTKHLTARTDDSHAAPVQDPRRKATFIARAPACQAQVRFFALHRIKPHAPLLVRAPVNFFEHLTRLLGDGGVESPHPECAPFRVGTTRVSNPVCSPDFRASASVPFQWPAFASGVLQDINAFHRYTLHSGHLSRTPALQFRTHFPG